MLHHLIPDPQYGLLLPRKQALNTFQTTDHHLRKCYPSLTEGHHLIRMQGPDHVIRVFFTLDGLLAIADLLNTPQAQTVKATILQATQAAQLKPTTQLPQSTPGALIPSHPTSPNHTPSRPSALTNLTPLPQFQNHSTEILGNSSVEPSPIQNPSPDPRIALVAQHLQAPLTQSVQTAVQNAIHSTPPKAPSAKPTQPPSLSHQQLAQIIHHTSEQTAQHIQLGINAAQTIQQTTADTIHTTQTNTADTLTFFHRAETWLDQQDRFALALVTSGLIALLSISTYCLAIAFSQSDHRPSPHPTSLS